MRELKFDIIFWDSINPKTIEHISIEEAYRENYIEFKNNTIIPTDECTIIRQFTGLKDKNGIDIYEGDILESEDRIVKITWHEQAGQWDSDFIKYTKDPCTNGLSNYDFKYKAEVIGNIHENPELINY